MNLNYIYRKLKISDYSKFRLLFYSCFNRNISYDFFKSRYFSDKSSFCFGVFHSSRLIANVGMVSVKLNKEIDERIYSRHSSMVHKDYRGKGIYSNLLKMVLKKVIKKTKLVVMWPNKSNYSNFGVEEKKIFKRKYYLYKNSTIISSLKKTNDYNICELIKFKPFFKNNKSFFLKNFSYFKKRYLSYKKHEYFLNKFKFKKNVSFFILKYNKDTNGASHVILDHFGSEKIKNRHFSNLINEKKIIFLSKKKINNCNFKLLNNLYFKVAFIKEFDLKQKRKLINKEIYLGDTDIFMSI